MFRLCKAFIRIVLLCTHIHDRILVFSVGYELCDLNIHHELIHSCSKHH